MVSLSSGCRGRQESGALEAVAALSPGREGAHPALVHPILQVARSTSGSLLAMGKGNSGHNMDPPELPSDAPVLFSAGEGQPWEEVSRAIVAELLRFPKV